MMHADQKRRWGVGQRLEFIEFRLFWEGILRRADITARFGVSAVQASADLAAYRSVAPENVVYDASQKRFIAAEGFRPKLLQPNVDRYLLQLRAVADGVVSLVDSSIGTLMPIDAMPIPHRRVDPQILRVLLGVIRRRQGLEVHYHSMNRKRPLPQWRAITPHALAFDGLRWHVRGYCHLESRFKDFVLSRILETGKEVAAEKKPEEDLQWQSVIEVVLVPNPKLAKRQRETIAYDYEMTNEQLQIPVRCALLYYFNKRLRLDVSDADDPKEAPIVLADKSAFLKALRLSES
jgi:hypothetical protein